MLIRDGEQLNLNGKELEPTEQWVKDKLQEIKKSRKVYVFKSTMKPVKLVDSDGGSHTDHRHYSVPTITTFDNEHSGMLESWQLILSSGGFRRKPDGTLDIRREPGILVSTKGIHLDSKTEAEKIFYLKYLSKSLANNKIYLEDKVSEAKKVDEELMLQDEAMRLISSPTSPISVEVNGSDEILKQISIAWGVPNVSNMTSSELKINLRNAVIRAQANIMTSQRGFKEFVDDANRLGDSDKRGTILLAIERGILKFEDNTWFLINREGATQFLISIPPNEVDRKDEWVIKHLVKKDSSYFYDLVESLLTNPAVQVPAPPKAPVVVYDRATYLKILKEELDWPHQKVFSRKDDFIKETVESRTKYEE